MLDLAQFFLDKNVKERSDYARKYHEMTVQNQNRKPTDLQMSSSKESNEEQECVKRLKVFRLKQSREEGVKPYYIYNDAQMLDLIAKNPKSKEELQTVSGFGKVKAEKYGDAILNILKGI